MASYGQCEASLRNGQRCRVVIETEGAEFCPHHLRLADDYGAERVRRGAVPKKRRLPVVADPASPTITTMEKTTPTGGAVPANVPMLAMLADAAAQSADQVAAWLLEAVSARSVTFTAKCPKCGERSRIDLPEVQAPVAATELLLREELGRPSRVEESRVARER